MSGAGSRSSAPAVLAIVLATGLALSGCGFAPLYAQPGVVEGLGGISIDAPKGRVGYLLTHDLDDSFGRKLGEAPVYRLELLLTQSRLAHGLTANDTAQRYEMDLKVTYTLVEIASEKAIHTGVVYSTLSYDSVNQPYAGIQARSDVQDRLASDAAQKMETQIAAWLATRKSG
jgi:LPS-assembly lipoprotein